MKQKILVLGGHGQLGQCLQVESLSCPDWERTYVSSADVDIRNQIQLKTLLERYQPDVVINCAAYTAVDRAEDEPEAALEINARAVGRLAELCQANHIFLVHISTDFVFSGERPSPLKETDITEPFSVYGSSKLLGETAIQEIGGAYVIIRTGWLYSEYGHNFLKTMLRVGTEKGSVGVVMDQVGTPTYARDLAAFIWKVVACNPRPQGIYHFSNEGVASWYDFAVAIFAYLDDEVAVKPLLSDEYRTKAKRPAYSVLDKSKVKKQWGLPIDHWQAALARCMQVLNHSQL